MNSAHLLKFKHFVNSIKEDILEEASINHLTLENFMKITSFFENGEKVWETSLRNTWTGKVIRKKFKNEKDASLYLQKYEETRAREKKY